MIHSGLEKGSAILRYLFCPTGDTARQGSADTRGVPPAARTPGAPPGGSRPLHVPPWLRLCQSLLGQGVRWLSVCRRRGAGYRLPLAEVVATFTPRPEPAPPQAPPGPYDHLIPEWPARCLFTPWR